MINGKYPAYIQLFSSHLLTTQIALTLQVFFHSTIHTLAAVTASQDACHLLIWHVNHSHTRTPMAQHQDQFGVHCLAIGHDKMLYAGSGIEQGTFHSQLPWNCPVICGWQAGCSIKALNIFRVCIFIPNLLNGLRPLMSQGTLYIDAYKSCPRQFREQDTFGSYKHYIRDRLKDKKNRAVIMICNCEL